MRDRRTRLPAGVERAVDEALDRALDTALRIERPAVLAYLDRIRGRDQRATPAEVVEKLERHYRAAATGLGGASGAAAAVPGVGTAAAVATGAAEIAGFVSITAMFVLALAEIHQIPVSDPEVRRALVMAVLLGEGTGLALEGAAAQSPHWAQVLGRATSRDKVAGINHRLASLALRRFGARQGALLVGRALPLGIGAGIGAAGNLALARSAIGAARRAFGPPPTRFPPRVLDVR